MRWKIETSYNHDKNVLQLGEFSGHTLCSIEQDFYAATFVSNLQSIIEKQCESYLKIKNKIRQHDYQINITLSFGSMKNKIVVLLLIKEPKIVLLELQNLFERHLEPIRINRNYERRKSKIRQSGKYKSVTNYKRVIQTLTLMTLAPLLHAIANRELYFEKQYPNLTLLKHKA